MSIDKLIANTTGTKINTKVTPTKVNEIINAINNSGTSNYKVYTAFLTQTGTDAPVATVLTNTLGGTIVWTYDGVGNYSGTLSNAFTKNKTVIFVGSPGSNTGVINASNDFIASQSILYLTTATNPNNNTGVNFTDAILYYTSIEIRVYN